MLLMSYRHASLLGSKLPMTQVILKLAVAVHNVLLHAVKQAHILVHVSAALNKPSARSE